MIKVLLADDQQLFMEGLQVLLEQEEQLEVTGAVTDGDQVIDFLNKNRDVDVVILDVEMPKQDGIQTTQLIRQNQFFKDIKILILTMYNEKNFILRLMEAGANGYILKNRSKEELVQAVYNVNDGKSHFGLEVLNEASSTKSELDQDVKLTEREEEILCLIAEGKTTKEISGKLFISEPTVNTHRRNLLSKLNFPNDKYLVRYAIKQGYVKL